MQFVCKLCGAIFVVVVEYEFDKATVIDRLAGGAELEADTDEDGGPEGGRTSSSLFRFCADESAAMVAGISLGALLAGGVACALGLSGNG